MIFPPKGNSIDESIQGRGVSTVLLGELSPGLCGCDGRAAVPSRAMKSMKITARDILSRGNLSQPTGLIHPITRQRICSCHCPWQEVQKILECACVCVCVCAHVCVGMYLSPSLLSSQSWQEACALMVLISMFISPHDGYSVFLTSCFLPTWIFPALTFPSAREIFNSFLWLLLYLSYVSPVKAASVFAVKPHISFHPKVTAHSLPSPLPLSWWTDSFQNSCDCFTVSENIEYYSWNKKQGQTDICKKINYSKRFM